MTLAAVLSPAVLCHARETPSGHENDPYLPSRARVQRQERSSDPTTLRVSAVPNSMIDKERMMLRARRTFAIGLAIASLAGFAGAQSPKRPMTIDDMMALKNVGGVAISPNGAMIAYTVSASETGRSEEHTSELQSPMYLVC